MAITIKDITQLPAGDPIGTSPIIYGNGTNLFKTTLNYILSQVDQGITDLSFDTIITVSDIFIEGQAQDLDFDIEILAGEIKFIKLNVVDVAGVFSENVYLIPLGAGDYTPLSTFLSFNDLILIDKKTTSSNPSGANTVTYTAVDLAEINSSDPSLDLTDTTKVYFIDLDDGFYRFDGTNGLYGLNNLQMVQGDLVSIQQSVEYPQPATATPPASGTFSVSLNNFFGTDYSSTTTALTTIDIASGGVLGGFAKVKGNWASEPTVTGATQANNSGFTANVDLYLYFEKWSDKVVYWYDLD